VQHEQVEHDVPHIKACDFNGSFERDVQDVQREGNEIRRVQAPDSSFPEFSEVDYRFLNTSRARSGPMQVDAIAGDDEKQVYTGEREMDEVLSEPW
jgi:hypothetical protein